MAYLPRSLARLCGGIALGTSVAACLLSTTTSAAAASAPCSNTTDGISVVLASPSGGTQSPACVTQQGNVLIIVLPQSTPGTDPQTQVVPTVQPAPPLVNTQPTSLVDTQPTSLVNTQPTSLNTPPTSLVNTQPTTLINTKVVPTTTPTPTTPASLIAPIIPSAPEPDMSAIVDPRINTYAKRQAIRDQYRGQIDEVTFNDELGDGVPVETALADAIAAFNHPKA